MQNNFFIFHSLEDYLQLNAGGILVLEPDFIPKRSWLLNSSRKCVKI